MARSTAQTHLKIERQRRDFHFKTAKRYADTYRTIVVEDLPSWAGAQSIGKKHSGCGVGRVCEHSDVQG
jgi:hypothetical protein